MMASVHDPFAVLLRSGRSNNERTRHMADTRFQRFRLDAKALPCTMVPGMAAAASATAPVPVMA
jgi:hypothetical protein